MGKNKKINRVCRTCRHWNRYSDAIYSDREHCKIHNVIYSDENKHYFKPWNNAGLLGRCEDYETSYSILQKAGLCGCGKRGKERTDNGLRAGTYCNKCWEKTVREARKQSY